MVPVPFCFLGILGKMLKSPQDVSSLASWSRETVWDRSGGGAVPALFTNPHSSFCLGWSAEASCCRNDVICHIERYTPNHSIIHIPDMPILKAGVKQRITLNMSGGFNLFATEPDYCCLLFHICILPSVLASLPSSHTNYYTPISVVLHPFPLPLQLLSLLSHLPLPFPGCHIPFSSTSISHHKSFPSHALFCICPPAAVAELQAQPQNSLNLLTLLQICPLNKYSKKMWQSIRFLWPYIATSSLINHICP